MPRGLLCSLPPFALASITHPLFLRSPSMYDGTELAALQEEEEKQNLEQEDEEHGQFVPLRFDSASLNRDPDGWLPSEQQGEEGEPWSRLFLLRSC